LISIILNGLSFLNPEQKKKFRLITLIIILGSLFEAFSIYILYLTLKIFIDYNNFIAGNNYFLEIYKKLRLEEENLILYLLFFLLIIFILKFIYFSKMYFYQFKYINNLMVNLSSNLLSKYLSYSIEFHSNEDNSKLIRNIKDEIGMYCTGLIQQIVILFNEIAIFISIISLTLFVVTKQFLILVCSIIILSIIYYAFIKPIYHKFGLQRQFYTNLMIKFIINPISAIKDVKIFRAENYFYKKFKHSVEKLGYANAVVTTLNQIPRLGLELFTVIMISVFILYNFNKEIINGEFLSSTGLLAISAFKLIPSISKILNSLNGIKFASPSLQILNSQYGKLEPEANKIYEEELTFKNSIVLENLAFKYKNKDKFLYENLNIKIPKNSSFGLVGKSGSGKSTLIDIICGFHKPNKGRVLVDDKDINQSNINWLHQISYIPQKVFIINDSLKKNIALGIEEKDINSSKLIKIIQQCRLEDFLSCLSDGFDTELGDGGKSISGGEAQRIGIARALYKDTDVLILDEITSSLDPVNEKKIIDIIKELSISKTIIMITHNEKILDFCSSIYSLENGNLIKKN
jgi:ATP-binding cassette, subfamily B, bacterial PglK